MELNNSEESPRKRRTRSDKGKPRTAQVVRDRTVQTPKAAEALDTRIATLIEERGAVVMALSKLAYWQQRLVSLDQELERLIGIQQRLIGVDAALPPVAIPPAPPVSTTSTYSHLMPMPATAGSIPAKQPKPTTMNVADDISGEGGFQ